MKEKGTVEKRVHTFFVQEKLYETIKSKYNPKQLDCYWYMFDRINRVMFTYRDLEYVQLSSKILQWIFGWRNYTEVIQNLVYGKYVERTFYRAGKCYGYRIAKEYADDKCIFIQGTKKLKHFEIDQEKYTRDVTINHQYANLERLSIERDEAAAYIEAWHEKFCARANSSTTSFCSPYPSFSKPDMDNNLISYVIDSTQSIYNDYYEAYEPKPMDIKEINKRKEDRRQIPPYVTPNKIFKINIDETDPKIVNYTYGRYNQDRLWVSSLTNSDYVFRRDKQGRLYTNVVNCPKRLRRFLRVDGIEELCIVDIANSQPLLLNLLLGQYRLGDVEDVKRYRKDTEEGKFYEKLMHVLGLHDLKRGEFKVDVLKHGIYSKYRYESDVMTALKVLYPTVWEFIISFKNTPRSTELPLMMQREEAQLIIDNISPRLHDMGIWHLTIHDAILCDCDSRHDVCKVMIEEYSLKGLTPMLDVKKLK